MKSYFRRFFEKHMCAKTELVIQAIMFEGAAPQVRVQVVHKCNKMVLGSTLIEPFQMPVVANALMQAADVAKDPKNFEHLIN